MDYPTTGTAENSIENINSKVSFWKWQWEKMQNENPNYKINPEQI